MAQRTPTFPILPLILNRWSARSMSGEKISESELLPLFEAARWAPSSRNNQPWIFIYALRETVQWQNLFELLVESNQQWARNASALVVVVSKNTFYHNGQPSRTHSFDTGAAWMLLALEGSSRGYVIHGMEGFDYEKTRKNLGVPEDHTIEAMIAIGKPAPKEKLPLVWQAKEAPSLRRDLDVILMKGRFEKRIEQV